MPGQLKPSVKLSDLIRLFADLGGCYSGTHCHLHTEIEERGIDVNSDQASMNFPDLRKLDSTFDLARNCIGRIVTRETCRRLLGDAPPMEHWYINPAAFAQTAIRNLEALKLDGPLTPEHQKEIEKLLPALAEYTAWGAAIIDKADTDKYTPIMACNKFLLNQTNYNQNGDFTQECQRADRAIRATPRISLTS